jgi:hypothetical protein
MNYDSMRVTDETPNMGDNVAKTCPWRSSRIARVYTDSGAARQPNLLPLTAFLLRHFLSH